VPIVKIIDLHVAQIGRLPLRVAVLVDHGGTHTLEEIVLQNHAGDQAVLKR
jgi:hypothetical protein